MNTGATKRTITSIDGRTTTNVMTGDSLCFITSDGDADEHRSHIAKHLAESWVLVFDVRLPSHSVSIFFALLRRGLIASPATPTTGSDHRLSPRERQVLDLARRGCTPREMAHQLELSRGTIYVYRSRVRRKLGVPPSADLTQFAQQQGQDAA